MQRIVFTYGTLYIDDIIKALLGRVPVNFYATLSGYSIYKGNFSQLAPKIKKFFITKNPDETAFSYLFAKEDRKNNFIIKGRAYEINSEEERILDHWERYPDWYRKKTVVIKAIDGVKHEAFIYTLDIDGEKVEKFKRVVNNRAKVLARAKAVRARVLEK